VSRAALSPLQAVVDNPQPKMENQFVSPPTQRSPTPHAQKSHPPRQIALSW
jgi:hypothetical protein